MEGGPEPPSDRLLLLFPIPSSGLKGPLGPKARVEFDQEKEEEWVSEGPEVLPLVKEAGRPLINPGGGGP
jgi:hypothetical protein